jgi:hypothetical protein
MKIENNGVTAYFMNIGNQDAKAILLRNAGNRRIDKNRVAKYRNDMDNGFWVFNGDAIRFDKLGNLIDGQHRLSAISQQEKSFTFLVIEGVVDESKRTIDTGKSRTGSDVLSMFSGVKTTEAGILSSAITRLLIYYKGRVISTGGGSVGYTTNSLIEEFYKTNYIKLMKSLNFVTKKSIQSAMVLARADALFLHYIFSEIDGHEADLFMSKILSGAEIMEGTNENLCRNILLKKLSKNLKITQVEAIYTVIKAWNRNRKGGAYNSEGSLKYYRKTDSGLPVAK